MKRLFTLTVVLVALLSVAAPLTAQGDVATIIYTQEPDLLNRMYSSMWYSDILTELWQMPAIVFDGDLNPTPMLLTEVPSGENGGISEDGTVITFNLRDDVVWSDGEPMTSADFIFTYDMYIAEGNLPISRYPYDVDSGVIASMEAPDDYTVIVNFVEPFAPWMSYIFDHIIPEHVLGPVFEAEGTIDNADWNRAPTVTLGPFVFSEWESGGHLLFTRNDNWIDPPVLDGIFFRIVPDDAAQIAALLGGDGDIGTFMSYSDFPQLEEAGIVLQMTPSGYNEAWFFNLDPETAHPAMLDINVRKALQHASPRQLVCDTLLLGRTYPAGTFWENTPFDNPDVESPAYDLEEAARLLDDAGWVDSDGDGVRDKDGVALELRYLTPPRQVRMDTQVVTQQHFAEVGIALVLDNPSYDVFWNSYGSGGPVATGGYDLAQWSSNTAFPDPHTPDFLCSEIANEDNPEGNNWFGYCEEDVDALLQEQATTVDFAARQALFWEIGALMDEDVVWTGVWHDPDWWAVSDRLQNVVLNGAQPFWNASEWALGG